MPRKQRFKPSRKPKPAEPMSETTANENRPVEAAQPVGEKTPAHGDVSHET